ncbi:argininosuccinate lyase [Mortierella antarctica]|nr:argininosuccinate lyase [Mortierella antarctica]
MASQQQQPAARKLWGGRFTGKTDPLMEKFNASISFDSRFYKADIVGSQAYAKALARKGIITQEEASKLHEGLDLVLAEWEANSFKLEDGDEDIHTANERRLGELIGTHISGKLHTGRSRNDQVATDFRIWVRDEGHKLVVVLKQLIAAAVVRAQNEIDVIMPGYTHLQRAQPIRWSHLILSHAWSWHADCQRLEQLLDRLNQLPLGSGALAGNPFQIDRDFLAKELGFARVMPNSLYGVSDRDFVAEFLFWASLTMHWRVWLCSVGSLMPQKKNPDSLELLRGKSGRVFGGMSGFMMAYKGTPSTYNKDLQEDKEPVFDAYDTLMGSIQITTGVLATLKIRPEKMLASLSIDMLATDLAEYLVRKGVPFRETHHISGEAVRMAEERQCTMADLSLEDFKSLHPSFEADVANVWNFEQSIDNRCTPGGTSRVTVQAQIESLKEFLGLAGVSNVSEYLETHDLV